MNAHENMQRVLEVAELAPDAPVGLAALKQAKTWALLSIAESLYEMAQPPIEDALIVDDPPGWETVERSIWHAVRDAGRETRQGSSNAFAAIANEATPAIMAILGHLGALNAGPRPTDVIGDPPPGVGDRWDGPRGDEGWAHLPISDVVRTYPVAHYWTMDGGTACDALNGLRYRGPVQTPMPATGCARCRRVLDGEDF